MDFYPFSVGKRVCRKIHNYPEIPGFLSFPYQKKVEAHFWASLNPTRHQFPGQMEGVPVRLQHCALQSGVDVDFHDGKMGEV